MIRATILFLAGFFLLTPLGVVSAKNDTASADNAQVKYSTFREAYDAGSQLLKARKFTESVDAYRQAENLAGSNLVKAQAANAAGWTLTRARKWAEARELFRHAAQLNPQNKVALGNLGFASLKLYQFGLGSPEDLKESLKALESCSAIDPAYKDDLLESVRTISARLESNANATPVAPVKSGMAFKDALSLGDQLQAAGQYDLALQAFKRAEETGFSPKSKGAAANRLGLALLESCRPKEALAHFERAVKIVPGEKVFLNNMGLAQWTLYDAGLGDASNLKQSVDAFFKANSMDPSYRGENLKMALDELREVEPEAAKPYESQQDPATGDAAPMGSPTTK